eukprot:2715417-Amphidinium_carterae.1
MSNLSKAQGAAYQYVLVESECVYSNGGESKGFITDVPLIHVSETKSTTPSYTHMFEIFSGLEHKPDLSIIPENPLEQLEPPFGFNDTLVNIDVQYFLAPDKDTIGAWTLIKHIINRGRVLLKRVNVCCTGELYIVDSKKLGASKHAGVILQH